MRKIYSNQKTNHFKDEKRTHSNLQNILLFLQSLAGSAFSEED